jgi:phosphohistidine phosphatase SixA
MHVLSAQPSSAREQAMIVRRSTFYLFCRIAIATLLLSFAGSASADELAGDALVTALRQGGYVIVMRHPSSPFAQPDKATANPDNTHLERQLDEKGRSTVRAMGEAFRKLEIPIGDVLSSPTYRALEAVRVGAFGKPKTFPELGEGAQGMKQNADASRSAWLRMRAAQAPRARTDTLIVTHTPNLTGAFAAEAANMEAGEALVFHPDGKGGTALVARIRIEEWPKLAAAH